MCVAPSTVAIGRGACSVTARQRLGKSGGGASADGFTAIIHCGKKSSSLQRSSQLQHPSQVTQHVPWSLVLEVSLVLGCWCLELSFSLLRRFRFRRFLVVLRFARAGARGNS